MWAEPLKEADLTARLSKAKVDYESNWKVVDDELYELCRRRGCHKTFNDAYAKVAIIGRVYMAGVPRAWGGRRGPDNDPEADAARALTREVLAALIQEGLQRLEGRPFNQQVASEIVGLHRDVTAALRRESRKSLHSFVSKYLHFHNPIVPIYDSRAEAAIGKLVRRQSRSVQRVLAALPEGVPLYRSFVAAFVVLHECAAGTTPGPSVKELDHLLWRFAPQPGSP